LIGLFGKRRPQRQPARCAVRDPLGELLVAIAAPVDALDQVFAIKQQRIGVDGARRPQFEPRDPGSQHLPLTCDRGIGGVERAGDVLCVDTFEVVEDQLGFRLAEAEVALAVRSQSVSGLMGGERDAGHVVQGVVQQIDVGAAGRILGAGKKPALAAFDVRQDERRTPSKAYSQRSGTGQCGRKVRCRQRPPG
jgi:hypothetical protein